MDFVNYLREYCEKNYITAYELSKKSDVSMTYCYRLLGGQMENPSIKVIIKISQALDISYSQFFTNMKI